MTEVGQPTRLVGAIAQDLVCRKAEKKGGLIRYDAQREEISRRKLPFQAYDKLYNPKTTSGFCDI